MKPETLIGLASLVVGIASAVWTYRAMREARDGGPPTSSQYHAKNNPHGFTREPGGTWVRITPNGERVYYT